MISLQDLAQELSHAEFGDKRLSKRLGVIASQVSEQPACGLPTVCGSDAALEAIYRFLGNERVSPDKILFPHIRGTCERMAECKRAFVIHDSSCFMFPGESDRVGLQRFSKHKQGFWGHFALAISRRGSHPLGVAGLHTFLRDGSKSSQSQRERKSDPTRESTRWLRLVEEVEKHNAGRAQLVHVMDREGDNNQLFNGLISNNRGFVIRVRKSRLLPTVDGEDLQEMFRKDVYVSRRKDPGCPHERKFYPPRESRKATLTFSASPISISVNGKERLNLNVVIAKEIGAPTTEAPVEWRLFTSEPIDTAEQVEQVVEAYRGRWLIEEFFKALKTGCAYEKRQLESRQTLLNALAVFAPVAAQMLLLRSISRTDEKIPLSRVLNKSQIEVLRRFSKVKLPKRLGVKSAMMGIAAMGGHITNNGPPGWIVLGRGFDKLMTLEMAWVAARRGCDQ